MNKSARNSWVAILPRWAGFGALLAVTLHASAQEPRLTLEFGQRAEGYVSGIAQGNNGDVIVSGSFRAPNRPRFPEIPSITVLGQDGQVRQRLAPPVLPAATGSEPSPPVRYAWWRVREALPQGRYIVDDGEGYPPGLLLTPDGLPDYRWGDMGYPSLTGQTAVQPHQGVLMARNPWDPDRFAAIERWGSQGEPSAYDPSFGSNVFSAWPVRGLSCVRMAVTGDGHVWAWLGDGKVARLFRLLPNGRPDPHFQPVPAVESFYPGFNAPEWLGLVPDGSVIINAWETSRRLAWRRLQPEGRDNPEFDASGFPALLESGMPVLPLSDGSMLVMVFLRGPDGAQSWVDLLRIAANGRPDPAWHPAMPLWWRLNAWPDIRQALLQDDGKVVVVLSGFRTYELARFNPDGRPDPSLDASTISPTPVPILRLSLSGLQVRSNYWLESKGDLGSEEWSTIQEISGDTAIEPGPHLWGWYSDFPEPSRFWRLRQAVEAPASGRSRAGGHLDLEDPRGSSSEPLFQPADLLLRFAGHGVIPAELDGSGRLAECRDTSTHGTRAAARSPLRAERSGEPWSRIGRLR